GKGIAALALEPLDARLDQGVVRRRKRQLVDDDALEGLARNVDALPEALRADENGTARIEEALHQLALGPLALDKDLDLLAGAIERDAQSSPDSLQRAQRRRQHEGAAAQRARAARRERGDGVGMARLARLDKLARHE